MEVRIAQPLHTIPSFRHTRFPINHLTPLSTKKENRIGSDDDNEDDKDKKEDAETKTLRLALAGAVLQEKASIRWEDFAGLEGGKESLKEAVILPIKFPHLFTGKRAPWKGILLYDIHRLVNQLFTLARENKPATIFVDGVEFTGKGRARPVGGSRGSFLVRMQGVGNDMQGVLVLGARNILWQLDPAISATVSVVVLDDFGVMEELDS
ncbi:Vacuolar protein sorting-associated protein 4 [Rhizophlyctis rosea]|nr:Vacuolar protein sorting-associated protein 4 [Rhizophlyctis rosea]